ncbi:A24 family peptidase [Falsiroseomonas sp. E2-1-a4]|uniref:A24 family peptidase n=1 Tax=Falsiroseomonas sp. E2-1-a4 TaxID=3239299 RepID=UPI003F3F715B
MSSTFVIPALLLLAFAAWRDVATRRIPNSLCLVLAAIGLMLRGIESLPDLLASLLTAGALFLLLFLLFARGLLGGGDVKLLTALSLGLPPIESWNLVVATTLAGGALACLYLLLQRLLTAYPGLAVRARTHATALRRVLAVEAWRIRQRGPMPYGVAIAIGGAVVLLQTQGG